MGNMRARSRRSGWRALVVLGAAVAAWALVACESNDRRVEDDTRDDAARLMNDLMSGKASVGGPFTLTDQHGRSRSLADFRGKLILLYFGYTFCPDVCPTDLLAIGESIAALGEAGDAIQPIFVTLDPQRDTQNVLGEYVKAFHARFVALHGSEAETRRIATAYKVSYRKAWPAGASTYVIDHAAFTFLLDREGRYVAFFPPGTKSDRMTTMLREALQQPG